MSIAIKYLHIYFSFHRLTYQYICGRMGEGLHRFKGLHWVKDANIQVFLVAFFSACSTSTNSVCLQKNPMKDKFTYWHILPFSTELQCRHYTSWGFHMRHSLKWDHHIYIYLYVYIYILICIYIYTYGIHQWRILWSCLIMQSCKKCALPVITTMALCPSAWVATKPLWW